MDKNEYKVRADEIKSLVAGKQYADAAKVADTIDWTRVKSVMMLTIVSDIYKVNRRYEDSKAVLLLAYERHSGGRSIVYSLCELSIKMEEYVQAVEYYKEFVQIAPKDTGRYILQYKLYEAQEVSLNERISVLEEFKRKDYREKWAYELAYLYHRIGLETKCVEECDELVLWFGDGKYVLKAMELKMLHEPLNPAQQDSYDRLTGRSSKKAEKTKTVQAAAVEEPPYDEHSDIHVKTPDMSRYNTINLQKELADSMKEFMYGQGEQILEQGAIPLSDHPEIEEKAEEVFFEEGKTGKLPAQEAFVGVQKEDTLGNRQVSDMQESPENLESALYKEFAANSEAEINQEVPIVSKAAPVKVPPINSNTYPSQEAFVNSEGEFNQETPEGVEATAMKAASESKKTGTEPANIVRAEKTQGNVAEIREFSPKNRRLLQEEAPVLSEKELGETREYVPLDYSEGVRAVPSYPASPRLMAASAAVVPVPRSRELKEHEFEKMLAQEYDGQLSLVVPEGDGLEKQITGQMDIHDILASWEEAKKQNQEKRMADVKRKVSEHTGQLFSEFDEAAKNDLLAKLEEASRIEENRQAGIEKDRKPQSEIKTKPLEEIPENLTMEQAASEDEAPALMDDTMESSGMELDSAGVSTVPEEMASLSAGGSSELLGGVSDDPVSKEPDSGGEALPDPLDKQGKARRDSGKSPRSLSAEEEELFSFLLHSRKARRELVAALDAISLAPYTGNILVAGEEHGSSMEAAMNLIKEIQLTDSNFSGKVAKVSASALEGKNIAATFGKLDNGALIVEKAGALSGKTVDKMLKVLDQSNKGIIIVLEDTPKNIEILLERHSKMKEVFNARITVPQMNNDALVEHARIYAMEQEYAIDDLGILALYTRIAEMQTSDHVVSIQETEEIVEDAIYHANKKNLPHFIDVLFGKRYDAEDMIVLREKDFINY